MSCTFVLLQYKAYKLRKKLEWYKQEKMRSIETAGGQPPKYTCIEKYHHFCSRVRRNIQYGFRRVFSCPPNSKIQQFFIKLRLDGTLENFILKSAIGFLGGVILTYLLFMFFVFQLNFNLTSATIICFVLGIFLTLGLAFSLKFRCITFLLLPIFFSKKGRQALMAYAFILALTGPAKNTLHNMGVLSESLACGQEELKRAASQIMEMIKQPFIAMKHAIQDIMKTVKKIIVRLKEALLSIKRVVMGILGVFKAAGQWLGGIVNICNKKVGTPYQRCVRVFDTAIDDCYATLGPMFNWLCSITYIAKLLCYIVKFLDFICMLFDLIGSIGSNMLSGMKRKLKEFINHVRTIFYVSVDFHHSFHFETNQSKGAEEVTSGIVTEIRTRTDKFLTIFDFMSCIFGVFFLFLLFRVWHYRHKFLTNDRFDNHYITSTFRDLDLRRAKMDQEQVLPLNRREATKYIQITSVYLVASEKLKLTKSAVFLGVSTFKLLIHMAMDYCLYWVLSRIRFHGRFQSEVEAPSSVGIRVEGEGAVSDIYKGTVKAFSPLSGGVPVDTIPCLPDPLPPNTARYLQIVSLIGLCWLMAVLEPYGLRIRHIVMCYYHPDRAQQRTVWLYNNIIRSRGSFLKFARRQLRRKSKGDSGTVDKVTFMERLKAKCPLLGKILGTKNQEACLLCAHVVRENDEERLIHCSTPGCMGKYCTHCFADLANMCTVCMSPVEYGDNSDMSQEKDSSDEPPNAVHKPKRRKKKKDKECTEKKKCLEDDDDDVEKGGALGDTTDESSEVSYGYQDKNFDDRTKRPRDKGNAREKERVADKLPFKDIEQQYRVELASTQNFHQPLNWGNSDGTSDTNYLNDGASNCSSDDGRHRLHWSHSLLDNEGKTKINRARRAFEYQNPDPTLDQFNPFSIIYDFFTQTKSNTASKRSSRYQPLAQDSDNTSPWSSSSSLQDIESQNNVKNIPQKRRYSLSTGSQNPSSAKRKQRTKRFRGEMYQQIASEDDDVISLYPRNTNEEVELDMITKLPIQKSRSTKIPNTMSKSETILVKSSVDIGQRQNYVLNPYKLPEETYSNDTIIPEEQNDMLKSNSSKSVESGDEDEEREESFGTWTFPHLVKMTRIADKHLSLGRKRMEEDEVGEHGQEPYRVGKGTTTRRLSMNRDQDDDDYVESSSDSPYHWETSLPPWASRAVQDTETSLREVSTTDTTNCYDSGMSSFRSRMSTPRCEIHHMRDLPVKDTREENIHRVTLPNDQSKWQTDFFEPKMQETDSNSYSSVDSRPKKLATAKERNLKSVHAKLNKYELLSDESETEFEISYHKPCQDGGETSSTSVTDSDDVKEIIEEVKRGESEDFREDKGEKAVKTKRKKPMSIIPRSRVSRTRGIGAKIASWFNKRIPVSVKNFEKKKSSANVKMRGEMSRLRLSDSCCTSEDEENLDIITNHGRHGLDQSGHIPRMSTNRYSSAEASLMNALRCTERETVSLKRKLCQMKRNSQQNESSGMERMDFSVERVTELPKYVQVLPFMVEEKETAMEPFTSGEDVTSRMMINKTARNVLKIDDATGTYYKTDFSMEQVLDLPRYVQVYPSRNGDQEDKDGYKIKPVSTSEDEMDSPRRCGLDFNRCGIAAVNSSPKNFHVPPRLNEEYVISNSTMSKGSFIEQGKGKELAVKTRDKGGYSWQTTSSLPIYMRPPPKLTEINEGKYNRKLTPSSSNKSYAETKRRSRDAYTSYSSDGYDKPYCSPKRTNNFPVFTLPKLSNTSVRAEPFGSEGEIYGVHLGQYNSNTSANVYRYSSESLMNRSEPINYCKVLPHINEIRAHNWVLKPQKSDVYETDGDNVLPETIIESVMLGDLCNNYCKESTETSSDHYDQLDYSCITDLTKTDSPLTTSHHKTMNTLDRLVKKRSTEIDIDNGPWEGISENYSGDISSTAVSRKSSNDSTVTLKHIYGISNLHQSISDDVIRDSDISDGYDKVEDTSETDRSTKKEDVKQVSKLTECINIGTQTDSSTSNDSTITREQENIYKAKTFTTIKKRTDATTTLVTKPKSFNEEFTQISSCQQPEGEGMSTENPNIKRDFLNASQNYRTSFTLNRGETNIPRETSAFDKSSTCLYKVMTGTSDIPSSNYYDKVFTPRSCGDVAAHESPSSSSTDKYHTNPYYKAIDSDELILDVKDMSSDSDDNEEDVEEQGKLRGRRMSDNCQQRSGFDSHHHGHVKKDMFLQKWTRLSRNTCSSTDDDITHTPMTYSQIINGTNSDQDKSYTLNVNREYNELVPSSGSHQDNARYYQERDVDEEDSEGLRPSWNVTTGNNPQTRVQKTEELRSSWNTTGNCPKVPTKKGWCTEDDSTYMRDYVYNSEDEEGEFLESPDPFRDSEEEDRSHDTNMRQQYQSGENVRVEHVPKSHKREMREENRRDSKVSRSREREIQENCPEEAEQVSRSHERHMVKEDRPKEAVRDKKVTRGCYEKMSPMNQRGEVISTKVKRDSNGTEYTEEVRFVIPRQQQQQQQHQQRRQEPRQRDSSDVSSERQSIFQRFRIPGLSPRKRDKKRLSQYQQQYNPADWTSRRKDHRDDVTDPHSKSPESKRKWFQRWTRNRGSRPSTDDSMNEIYTNPSSTAVAIDNQDSLSRLGLIDPTFYEIKQLPSEYDMTEDTTH